MRTAYRLGASCAIGCVIVGDSCGSTGTFPSRSASCREKREVGMDRRFGLGRRGVPLLTAVGVTLVLMLALPGALLATAPPAPASFTTAFVDDFNGAAGTSVSGTNWRFDTGQGIFGTGEIETMTSSTNNVFLDGQG